MTKTFYITYWASKHKKHITRRGKHDDKSRFGVSLDSNLGASLIIALNDVLVPDSSFK